MIQNGAEWHYFAVKKTICIIKCIRIKMQWKFLLLELSSFFQSKKTHWNRIESI